MRVGFRTLSDAVAETDQGGDPTHLRRRGGGAQHDGRDRPLAGAQPYPTTVNHPKETDIAVAAMRAVAGAENVFDNIKPVMGSEDFAFMLKRVPGAYVFIGNGDTAPVHHPAYDFNDEAIPYGVAYWSELVQRLLPGD